MPRLLLLICLGLMACGRIFGQETIQVKATGVGVTSEQAEKAALVNAVQQAVGLFLDSETLVKDEQIIYDKILAERREDDFVLHCVLAPTNQSEPVRSAFVNTPWRLYGNGAGQPEGWDQPNEFKVALNVGTDRSRQQLRFALYAFSFAPQNKKN